MYRALPLLVLTLAVAAPAAAEELVVLPADTAIHRSPSAKSSTFDPKAEGYFVARKLGAKDGWIQIEVNGDIKWENHCVDTPWKLDSVAFEGWVRARDLATVTTNIVTTKQADGTFVSVGAGVPLRQTKKGWRAALWAVAWPIDVSDTDRGTTYEPRAFPTARGDILLAKKDLVIGGKPIAKTKGESYRVTNTVESDGKTRYRIAKRCLSVLADGELAKDSGGEGVMGGILGSLLGGDGSDYWVVHEGATAYWPDGARAGRFRRPATVTKVTEHGERLCGPVGLSEVQLEVCWAARDSDKKQGQNLADVFGGVGGLGLRGSGEKSETASGVSKNVVRRTLAQKQPEIARCYALEKHARGAHDSVELSFVVGPDGKVSGSKIAKSTLATNSPVHACLLKVANSLLFPTRSKATEVSYPLTLGPDR